jgi:hypothetical protein
VLNESGKMLKPTFHPLPKVITRTKRSSHRQYKTTVGNKDYTYMVSNASKKLPSLGVMSWARWFLPATLEPDEEQRQNYVGFEVLTAVVMKSTIFWDITPCISMKVNRRFGGTYRLHLQGRRISKARNQSESR